MIEHLNHLVTTQSTKDETIQFKLQNTFQLLTLCLTSKSFVKKIYGFKETFIEAIKKFLENSYKVKSDYSPPVMAKSLLCTIVVILELFPVSFFFIFSELNDPL